VPQIVSYDVICARQQQKCGGLRGLSVQCLVVEDHYETAHIHPELAPNLLEWPCQEQRTVGPVLTASAPVSDISAPACTNETSPPLRPVTVAQRNRPLTMLSLTVQSINLPMERIVETVRTRKQSNGCSTPASRSSATWQWIEGNSQKMKKMLCVSGCDVTLTDYRPEQSIGLVLGWTGFGL